MLVAKDKHGYNVEQVCSFYKKNLDFLSSNCHIGKQMIFTFSTMSQYSTCIQSVFYSRQINNLILHVS